MKGSRAFFLLLLGGVLFCCSYLHANTTTDQQKLKTLQDNIQQQQTHLDTQKKQYQLLNEQLMQQEKKISALFSSIHQAQSDLKNINQQISQLSLQLKRLAEDQIAQQHALDQQINLAFHIGPINQLAMLFDAAQSEHNERMLHYLKEISLARHKLISELQQTEQSLTSHKAQYETKKAQQQKLLQQLNTQQQSLTKDQQQRETILKELATTLSASQQQLNKLKQNQKTLETNIAEAKQHALMLQKQQKAAAQQSSAQNMRATLSGLGKPTATLPWPVTGKILQTYGESIIGGLQSRGIIIAAPEGAPVKAIAAGKVLLADWLQGYGLVIVLDHGKGEMSVYAYNENITVSVGQWVKQGETIARVGDTGGQKQTGLYFEIRQDGKALNPLSWLTPQKK